MKRLFIIPLALLGFGLMSVPPAGAADMSYEKSTQLRRSGAIAPAAPLAGRRIIQRRAYGTRMYESYPAYRERYGYARPYGYRYRTYGPRYRYNERYLERRGAIRDRGVIRDRTVIRDRDPTRDRDTVRDRGPDRERATPPGQDRGAQPPREDRGAPRPADRTDQPGSIRGRGPDQQGGPAARPDAAPRGGEGAPAVRERDRERRNP